MPDHNTMRATAEVRWFYPENLPDPVSDWFDAFDPESEPPRTDCYLHPTDPAMNVKWREGQIEVKRREAPGDEFAFAKDIHGVLERWRKWSFPLAEDPDLSEEALWRPVTKSRRMKSYRRDEQGQIVAADETLATGCEVELSILERGDEVWWSLCFEAFGEEAHLRDLLIQTAAHVFSNGTPPALDLSHSHGYAAWLL